MAKKLINDEIAAAIAAGAVKQDAFLAADGSPLKVRPMDSPYDPLEVGDVLRIPTDFQVLGVKFDPNDENEKPKSCIIVECDCADGSQRNWRFFPNSLCKTVVPYVDGHNLARVKSSGTAVDLYTSVDDVNVAMSLLKGKSIKIAAATIYPRKDWRTGEVKDTHIYQYDLSKA